VQIAANNIRLDKLAVLKAHNLNASGGITLHANGSGTFDNPQVNATISAPQLTIQNQKLDALHLQMDLANHVVHTALTSQAVERQGAAQQSGPQNHAPARLFRQSGPAMAGRKGLWMAEANRPAAPGQAARSGESGLAVRLQLRGAQPDPAAATDGSATGKPQGEVRLSNGCEPRG
jgi:hypothetical protein